MKRVFSFLLFCVGLFVMGMHAASAASLSLTLDRATAGIGDTITASLRLDSQGASVNAAQATIVYPKDLVEGVRVDTDESIFNFWVTRPEFTNTTGRLSFVGGSTSGFSGRSLLIWRAVFRVKGSGPINIVVSDAAVTAADGSGMNILSGVSGAFIASLPTSQVVSTAPAVAAASSTTQAPPPPEQIKRTPVPTSTGPITPALEVPLYPRQEGWYNASSNFLVKWGLPLDITSVATAFDQIPGTVPTRSEGLFDNKVFPAPKDGVWYVHVRFKNNIGWGKSANYRIAVDMVPPAAFEIVSESGAATDNPTPAISFKTGDPLSGAVTYKIQVDNGSTSETTQNRYVLPVQLPGKHTIRVTAFDQAGNATDELRDLTIIPLPSPAFADVSSDVFIGEGKLAVHGTGVPSSTVVVALKMQNGEMTESREARVGSDGNWETTFDHPLAKGKYMLEAFTRDVRGATSLVVQSGVIQARPRPFIVFLGLEITETVFFSAVILLLLIGFGAGWLTRSRQKRRREWRALISERDVAAVMESVIQDAASALSKYKTETLGKRETIETKQLLSRIQKTVKKAEGYLLKNIEDLNK